MKEALRLARRAWGKTHPNPMVGALVVKRGVIVGKGYHRRAGEAHAEVIALRDAGDRANGADLYVNLEPCCHIGATGPCVDTVIAARVRRVIVGMIDPNPRVNGKGIQKLKKAGIDVVLGVLDEEARHLNEAFITFITQKRPFVLLKNAITLDGYVATRTGDSRWITGEAARRHAHELRRDHQAIAVGVETIMRDNPQLTCRDVPRAVDPIRIVFDSRLRIPLNANVITAASKSKAPTWIITTDRASTKKENQLRNLGVEIIRIGNGQKVDLPLALRQLAERRIASLLVEGGPTLASALWHARLVDRVTTFIAPRLLGDARAKPMLHGESITSIDHSIRLKQLHVRQFDDDLMVTGIPDFIDEQ